MSEAEEMPSTNLNLNPAEGQAEEAGAKPLAVAEGQIQGLGQVGYRRLLALALCQLQDGDRSAAHAVLALKSHCFPRLYPHHPGIHPSPNPGICKPPHPGGGVGGGWREIRYRDPPTSLKRSR